MSLLIGPDTTFIRKGSVLALRAGHNIFLGREVSLLLGPDTTFIGKGSVFSMKARHYIF